MNYIVLSKESKSNCWNYVLSVIHWILQKLMIFFTFALYIRIILETNQFILVSWVSEIYQFNFSGVKRIISTIIALLAFIGWITIIVITFLFTLSKEVDKFSESTEKKKQICPPIRRSFSKQKIKDVCLTAPNSKSSFCNFTHYCRTEVFDYCYQLFSWIAANLSCDLGSYQTL